MTKSSNLLWRGLSCKSNTGLRCCNYRVPSIHKGFSTMIGLELELMAWLSLLDSLWSLPSNLDQVLPKEKAWLGQTKLGPHLCQSTQPNKHTGCNAILTWTSLRTGPKSLHCRVGLLLCCFL